MSEIELKIRKMKSGETLIACFENERDATTWLRERPDFVDVLGTADPDLDPAVGERLRKAMRPLDAEEVAFLADQKRLEREAREAAERVEAERAEREREAHVQRMQNIGANEPMVLRWTIDKGLMKGDSYDPREITPAAREAVEAWLEERRSWINAPKVLCEALVTVWPGVVPSGNEEDRVHEGGQFAAGILEE